MTLTSIWHQYKGEKTQLHKLHLEIQTNCSSVQGKLSQSTVLILGKQNSDINTPTKITLLTDLWWSVLSQGYKWEPGRSTSTPRVLPLLVILGIHTGCCDGVHWLWWRSLQHESSHYTSVSHTRWGSCSDEYATIFLHGSYSSHVEKTMIIFPSGRR